MKIRELFENEESMLRGLTWYHGGGDLTKFDMRFIGSGENNHILGRGIYFINDRAHAEMYTRYAKTAEKYIYEVQLRITGHAYDAIVKMDDGTRSAFEYIARELGLSSASELYDTPGHSTLKHGRGLIGGLFNIAGDQKAFELLKKYKIQASYEKIEPGLYEIAVFDPSIIVIKNKIRIE